MTNPKISLIFVFIIATLLFSSCYNSPSSTLTLDKTYPISTSADLNVGDNNYGYPVTTNIPPKNYYPEQVTVPNPVPGTGIIIGRLIQSSNGDPYLAPGIYLGKEIANDSSVVGNDTPSIISISPTSDPIAAQAQDGSFVFSNITPGEYRIFIWTPMSLTLLKDANSTADIVIQVIPGQIIDLGNIFIN